MLRHFFYYTAQCCLQAYTTVLKLSDKWTLHTGLQLLIWICIRSEAEKGGHPPLLRCSLVVLLQRVWLHGVMSPQVKVKELKSVVSDVQQNTMQRWGGTIADESRVSATQSKLDNFPSVSVQQRIFTKTGAVV